MINYSHSISKSLTKIFQDTLTVRSAISTIGISEFKILDRAFCFLCMSINVGTAKTLVTEIISLVNYIFIFCHHGN